MAQRFQKIKIGNKSILAYLIPLQGKNLILLKGSRGYVMCGYLNLKAAEKFKDTAIKIVGVSTVRDALKAKVHSCTSPARRLGIRKGQPLKEALKIIA
jgi:uncharacterized protein YunC (DUF1805 family)